MSKCPETRINWHTKFVSFCSFSYLFWLVAWTFQRQNTLIGSVPRHRLRNSTFYLNVTFQKSITLILYYDLLLLDFLHCDNSDNWFFKQSFGNRNNDMSEHGFQWEQFYWSVYGESCRMVFWVREDNRLDAENFSTFT